MSAEKDIVVVPFHQRVEEAINEGMEPRAFMEMLMVEYLSEWAGESRSVTIRGGGQTWSCIRNNPDREKPKKP